jgi:predicted Zn-dependent peptidase/outer membrane lipoprotein-sorting protein
MKKALSYILISSLILIFVACGGKQMANKPHEGLVYPPLNQPQPPVPERVELENGMIVYLLEDHELPIIDISLRVRTGSIYEPADKVGLADITGTVMRTGGTVGKTGDELDEILENLAASVEVGIGLSSGTGSMSVLKEDIDIGLSILADVLMNPAFREDKIELAKVQHRSAISRRNDDAQSIAAIEFPKLIHGADSPYARTTEYDTVNSITRAHLVGFHQKYFRPNNIILGVLGDFDSQVMLDKIREAFKEWESAAIEFPEKPKIPENFEQKIALVTKDDVNQTNIRMGHVGWLRSNDDYAALVVTCQILGIGFSSRLTNRIRVEQGLAYDVGNNYGAGYDVPGTFLIYCGTKSEATVTAISAILEEVERMRTEEVTDVELAQAIDGFMNSSVFDYDTKGKILGRAVRYAYYGYPQDFVEALMARIRTVTKADIKRVATEYLHPDKFTLLAVGKAGDFDQPLSTLGDVVEVDITIPPPSAEPVPEAGEADVAKARQILTAVVEAYGGMQKLKAIKNIVSQAKMTVNTPQGMMDVQVQRTVVFPNKARADLTVQATGMQMSQIYDGQSAWMTFAQGTQPLPESLAQSTQKSIFRETPYLLSYILNDEITTQYLGTETVNGKMAHVVLVSNSPADSVKLFIDPETKFIIRQDYTALTESGPVNRAEYMDDYRDVSGVKNAFHIVQIDNGQKGIEVQINEVTINAEVDESLFKQ